MSRHVLDVFLVATGRTCNSELACSGVDQDRDTAYCRIGHASYEELRLRRWITEASVASDANGSVVAGGALRADMDIVAIAIRDVARGQETKCEIVASSCISK